MNLYRLGDGHNQIHSWTRRSRDYIQFRFGGVGKGLKLGSEFEVRVDLQDVMIAVAEMELAGNKEAERIGKLLESDHSFLIIRQKIRDEHAESLVEEAEYEFRKKQDNLDAEGSV